MNKKDIEYYTFQYTIPVYKIKPPQKFNEYYQIHKDEIIVELDKENKRLQQKVNQLETNRDELKKWLEEEKNKHYDRKWLSDDELCYRLEDNSAKTLIEVQTKMEILERGSNE